MTGIAICVLAVTGCGGKTAGRTTSTTTSSATAARPATSETLKAAVRSSLIAYHRLSVQSLWSNAIGSHPAAIAGPALSDLRKALAQRRTRRVRVRLISDRFHIRAIDLDPSFETATTAARSATPSASTSTRASNCTASTELSASSSGK
jgi:hypothetical protein